MVVVVLGQAGGWGQLAVQERAKEVLFLSERAAARVLCQMVLFLFHIARHRGGLEQEKRRHCGSIGPGQPVARKIARGDGEQRPNSQTLPED